MGSRRLSTSLRGSDGYNKNIRYSTRSCDTGWSSRCSTFVLSWSPRVPSALADGGQQVGTGTVSLRKRVRRDALLTAAGEPVVRLVGPAYLP